MNPNLLWTSAAIVLAFLAYRLLPNGWTPNERLAVACIIWACIEAILLLIQANEDGRL